MENRPTTTSKNGGLFGDSSKTKARVIIIVASILAFAAALTMFITFRMHEKPKVMAGSTSPNSQVLSTNAIVDYPHVPGRILLRVKPEYRANCSAGDINIPSLRTLFAEFGITSIRKNFPHSEPIIGDVRNAQGQQLVDLSLIYELECDTAVDIPAACRLLAAHPALMYAEPRYIYETFFSPNDLYLSYQWYLDSMHVREAWDHSTGDTNVVIAIIDTGTDFGHEELDNEKIAYNYADPIDGIDNDNDGYVDNFKGWDFGGTSYWAPADNNPNWVGSGPGMDHGVLVAGVAVAQVNNSKGVAGVGYNTRYLPLKASIDQSLGISYGMDAIVYAADHGADILNLSWGSGAFSNYGQNICDYAAINKNCLVVAACGNQHTNVFVYPASYRHVISTAATQTQDQAWNTGSGTGTTYNYLVDISAPGRNTITTTGGNSYWAGATGTSMSAPLVCAVAALVKAQNPGLNAVQAGEVVRTTAENINAANPTLIERLGKGQVDAFSAVTTVNPKSVRFEDLEFYDGNNGIAESFDTLEIIARFVNYLTPTTNLTVDLSSPNVDMIDVLAGSDVLGNVGTMDSVSNDIPFKVVIKKHITEPTRIWFRFGMQDSNYTDYQYHAMIIYPNMIDLDANKLKTTLNGVGNFGFVDYPGLQYGLGLKYGPYQNVIRDAGFMVGISQANVVDMNRNELGARDQDNLPLQKPYGQNGPAADREGRARFGDSNAGAQTIGLDVQQRAYQWADPANDGYVIMEYVIRNTNAYPVNSAYAGLFAQWNRSFYPCSNANYYPGAKAVAARFNAGSAYFYTGMAMLSEQNINAHSTTESQFSFSTIDKFDALRNNPAGQTNQSGDVLQFISAGPFNIAPGDSVIVAFALVGGDDMQQLTDVADAARKKYHCELKSRRPVVDLGLDVTVCRQGEFPQLNAVATQGSELLWSTGDTSASILALQSGSYMVTVTNQYGCTSTDTVQVNLEPLGLYNISSSNTDFEAGTPVGFQVPDSLGILTSWFWDFGDGNTSNAPTPSHIYSEPGSYTVTAIVSNGFCSDTLVFPVAVVVTTNLNAAFSHAASFYPNPIQNQLNFKLEHDYVGPVDLEVYDAAGKLVKQNRVEKSHFRLSQSLDLTALPAGVYVARARAGAYLHSGRVVKQ